MPPEPTGPLAVSLMGSSWMNFILAIIRSCANKEKVKDLKELINPDQIGHKYHNVMYLYETLRAADCRAFASHNTPQNKTALYNYVQDQENNSNTYMSFFVTLTNTLPHELLRRLQYDSSFLMSFGCTYALISKCKQQIQHIHGVLIFAWPVTIKAVRTILCGVKIANELQVVGPPWSIEPIFCYQEYPLAYILNQEYERLVDFKLTSGTAPHPVTVKNLDTKEAEGYVFKYTPRYYLEEKELEMDERIYREYKIDEKYRKYIQPLMASRFFFTSDIKSKREALEEYFGPNAIVEVENPLNLTREDQGIILQKPVLIILTERRFDPAQVNSHLDEIKALFKYIIMKPGVLGQFD